MVLLSRAGGRRGQVGIRHQLWPFWHSLLIYHVKEGKGDNPPKYSYNIENPLLEYCVNKGNGIIHQISMI